MAGTYGHEKIHLDDSKALYKMSWQPKVTALAQSQVLATGYSCRSQIARMDGFKSKHPVEIIASALTEV